jgi:hypothetical protein
MYDWLAVGTARRISATVNSSAIESVMNLRIASRLEPGPLTASILPFLELQLVLCRDRGGSSGV